VACGADYLALSKSAPEPSTAVIILWLISNGPLQAQLGAGWRGSAAGALTKRQRGSLEVPANTEAYCCSSFPKEASSLW